MPFSLLGASIPENESSTYGTFIPESKSTWEQKIQFYPMNAVILGKVYFAKCGNLKRCILRNFTCGTFCKLHLRVFSAFRKIQIKSNNQLRVSLGLYLSFESTSAHHNGAVTQLAK